MQPQTPFDAALAELLRAWTAHDDLAPEADLDQRLASWRALDRARTWAASFDGAGRQNGLAIRPRSAP